MIRNVYDKAYKEYVKYCKKHGLNPYAKHTLTNKICRHSELRDKTPEEKVQYWYKLNLFKPDNPYLKYEEEKRFYDNYNGKKVQYTTYIKRIADWREPEEAIKYRVDKKYVTYYLNNKDRAIVDYPAFMARVRLWWDMDKALTLPKKRFLNKNK